MSFNDIMNKKIPKRITSIRDFLLVNSVDYKPNLPLNFSTSATRWIETA
jgi:hypothetical protein